MSNYDAGNANMKPTVGEKLKAAFSNKTAEEIHAENLAKKQEYADDNNVRHMQQERTINQMENNPTGTSNALNRLAGNNEYPTDGAHYTAGTMAPTAGAGLADTNNTRSSGQNVPVAHEESGRQQHHTGGTTAKTDTTLDVKSVTQDAFRQIDSQEQEAVHRAEQLKRRDEGKLLESSTGAFTTLEAQAEALKQKVEREKMAAEADIALQQSGKIQKTRERAELEKAAIHQAAMQRKAELEAKSNKLQSEIDELTRLKTEEMLREKPGDLQFQHVAEDTGVMAKLTGAVSHKLGVAERTNVTNSITRGHVEHQPSQVTKTYTEAPAEAQTHTQTYTRQGDYHELPTKNYQTQNMSEQEQQALSDSKRNV